MKLAPEAIVPHTRHTKSPDRSTALLANRCSVPFRLVVPYVDIPQVVTASAWRRHSAKPGSTCVSENSATGIRLTYRPSSLIARDSVTPLLFNHFTYYPLYPGRTLALISCYPANPTWRRSIGKAAYSHGFSGPCAHGLPSSEVSMTTVC